MSIIDMIAAAFGDVLVDITSDQIQILLGKLAGGEELHSLLLGGHGSAAALTQLFVDHGIDVSSMSNNDWAYLARVLATRAA